MDGKISINVTLDFRQINIDVSCHKGDEQVAFKNFCRSIVQYGGFFHNNKLYPSYRIHLIEKAD